MYDRPPIVALRDSLRTVVTAHQSRLDADRQLDLCQRVYEVVDELKAAGWPPERVIVAVKQVAAEAGLEPTRGVLAASTLNEQDAVVVALVRWCVERYYGAHTASST